MAKATGQWDVDKLEREMPVPLLIEWNEYLDWELMQFTRAILGAIPAAKSIGNSNGEIKLTDPDEIGGFLTSLGAKDG